MRAREGLCISTLARSRYFFTFDVLPDMCFMQIGENDVLNFCDDVIVLDILSLATYLHHGLGIRTVIVGQL